VKVNNKGFNQPEEITRMPDNSTPHAASQYDALIRNTIPYYNDFHAETIRSSRQRVEALNSGSIRVAEPAPW
jgi:hypothetical protein